ncbi:unnamed protein product [Brassica rapa subsp. narinosa]
MATASVPTDPDADMNISRPGCTRHHGSTSSYTSQRSKSSIPMTPESLR